MRRTIPLPLHPDVRRACGPGDIPLLHELADPQRGPSLCHDLASRLATALPGQHPGGGLLHAFSRWLQALLITADNLLPESTRSLVTARLDDDLGPAEAARLRGLFATAAPGLLEPHHDPVDDGTAGSPRPRGLLGATALLLALANPAAGAPLAWLGLDGLGRDPDAGRYGESLRRAMAELAVTDAGSALDVLETPTRTAPHRLDDQLLAAAEAWRPWLGDDAELCAIAAGVLREETRPYFDGPGEAQAFTPPAEDVYAHIEERSDAPAPDPEAEVERFSADREWMPRLILLAKNTHVWLHQLSETYGREIRTLDRIPDEELDAMARRGITGLWLIGLWQRGAASRAIKKRSGNPEALASAYSVHEYRIADDLGGDPALDDLRWRAMERGIRLCGDMVPNHTAVDGRWVLERPDLFLSLDHCPYPSYSFDGPELSPDPDVSIRLEDHYWDHTDASVVFRREDRGSGEVRYLYHGNDGTSMPWNDTAQLDFLNPETREAVIGTILEVARRFPVIRFDAAMVLARRHLRRLWHPRPGEGSDIPTRSAHALSPEAFDAALGGEFWREVVDRVAEEAPDTLLLAEAFWLMEGYFVRTLGMHRVYNSAFMHMLRDQDNATFRQGLKNVLDHDARILQRFVNFMSNPDEETAVDQFGKGDKYFAAATLLATLPGLPMIGHGQLEGFEEKYGMEYARSYRDEVPDTGFLEHHDRMISPLFHRREVFAGADGFRLYDARDGDGVTEDVIVFSNGHGDARALVVVNNGHEPRRAVVDRTWTPDGSEGARLHDLLGMPADGELFDERHDTAVRLRDGVLELDLPPYAARVFFPR